MKQETNTSHPTAKKVWKSPKIDVIKIDNTDIIAASPQGQTQQYNWEDQSGIWGN